MRPRTHSIYGSKSWARSSWPYDRDAVTRFWRILDWSDGVFDAFSGWFCGKTSPVQLYWHSLDLAFARFNGARAPARPDADPVTQGGVLPRGDRVRVLAGRRAYARRQLLLVHRPRARRPSSDEASPTGEMERAKRWVARAPPVRGRPRRRRSPRDTARIPPECVRGGRGRRRLGCGRAGVVMVPPPDEYSQLASAHEDVR
jgi:hypothetical protein